jgi:hypothetical protein
MCMIFLSGRRVRGGGQVMADAEKLAFEDRNSRLIYALDSTGNTAILKRVQESSVLISGLKGVGIEVGTRRRIVWSLAAVPSP